MQPCCTAYLALWQIVLQKSPSGLCEIEICNYRIGAPVLLNRCCAFQPDLESIFLAEMLKILLQHNLPCVDGSRLARTFFTPAGWSVQPCVRPVCAVHMTAGHNALRGSGPGQNRAFKDAMALTGCPDRRIDRLCITCCSPSQPSHHARGTGRDLVRPSARPDSCTARP